MHTIGLITDLAFVLVIASIMGLLARAARQPPVLGYLVAGLVVGPYIPIPIFADIQRTHALSELGIVLVMFAVGLELRLARLLRVLPTAGLTAVLEVGALLASGFAIGTLLGWNTVQSLFLGASIAISSTMIVSNVFTQKPVPDELREHTMSILVVQDVLAIVLAAILTAVAAGQGLSYMGVLGVVGKLSAVLIGLIALGLLIVPRAVQAIIKTEHKELLVVFCAGLCFGLAWTAEHLGYSVALGAFIAGILVAESGKGAHVEHLIQPTRDIFAAIFFVSIGMTVDPRLALDHIGTSLLLAAVVLVMQFFSVTVGGVLAGSRFNTSARAGLALGQVGEFGFILSAIGISAGVAPPSLAPIVVTVAVLTACTTPIMIGISEPFSLWINRRLPRHVRSFLTLYGAWIERLRSPKNAPTTKRHPLYTTLLTLSLESLVVVAVVAGISLEFDALRALLHSSLHTPAPWSTAGVVLIGLVLCLIPAWSFVHALRALTNQITPQIFGQKTPQNSPLARSFALTFQSTALLIIGLPGAVALTPVAGVWPFVILGFGIFILLMYLWKTSHQTSAQIESSVKRIGKLFAREEHEPSLPDNYLLPEKIVQLIGIKEILEFKILDNHYAKGLSLRELDLRAQTGATVLGVIGVHGEAYVLEPEDVLAAGCTVLVAGSSKARQAAQSLLHEGPPEEASNHPAVESDHSPL